jgi:hypothetical protein
MTPGVRRPQYPASHDQSRAGSTVYIRGTLCRAHCDSVI